MSHLKLESSSIFELDLDDLTNLLNQSFGLESLIESCEATLNNGGIIIIGNKHDDGFAKCCQISNNIELQLFITNLKGNKPLCN